jgi:hypothetical protein
MAETNRADTIRPDTDVAKFNRTEINGTETKRAEFIAEYLYFGTLSVMKSTY